MYRDTHSGSVSRLEFIRYNFVLSHNRFGSLFWPAYQLAFCYRYVIFADCDHSQFDGNKRNASSMLNEQFACTIRIWHPLHMSASTQITRKHLMRVCRHLTVSDKTVWKSQDSIDGATILSPSAHYNKYQPNDYSHATIQINKIKQHSNNRRLSWEQKIPSSQG